MRDGRLASVPLTASAFVHIRKQFTPISKLCGDRTRPRVSFSAPPRNTRVARKRAGWLHPAAGHGTGCGAHCATAEGGSGAVRNHDATGKGGAQMSAASSGARVFHSVSLKV